MKNAAYISGLLGKAILLDNENVLQYSLDTEQPIMCDLIEYNQFVNQGGELKILSPFEGTIKELIGAINDETKKWDALQLALDAFDVDYNENLRSRSLLLLQKYFDENSGIETFVWNRMFGTVLPTSIDIESGIRIADAKKLRNIKIQFVLLRDNIQNINLIHKAFDWCCPDYKFNNNYSKEHLEKVLVDAGVFRNFVLAIGKHSNDDFDAAVSKFSRMKEIIQVLDNSIHLLQKMKDFINEYDPSLLKSEQLIVNSQVVWENCLEIIKDNVDSQNFKTWFEPIIPVRLKDKILTVQLPSLFFFEWFEEHYVSLLKKIIKKEIGTGAKLEFNIIVENSSHGTKPHTIRISAQQNKSEDDLKISIPSNDNSFIIPDIKKVNIDSQLNTAYSFNNFIEGDCNRLARSAGQAVAARPGGTSFNPLFIYGSGGLGKTHLAQAIGNQVKENLKNKKVLYITSEKFTRQFLESIKNNSINNFVNSYKLIDLLIVDDIQFFANKDKAQNIFFDIFNHLQVNGKQLVLTSDRPPKDLKGIEERLLSRFKWGLAADLQIPDFDTRYAIMENKMYAEDIELNKDVIEYVAYNMTGNVRELEGALISLLAHSSLTGKEIDLKLAKDILKNFVKRNTKELTIEHIQKLISDHYEMPIDLLESKTRKRHIVQARQIIMYFYAKNLNRNSLSNFEYFEEKDNETVIQACRTVLGLIQKDNQFKNKVIELENFINMNLK